MLSEIANALLKYLQVSKKTALMFTPTHILKS